MIYAGQSVALTRANSYTLITSVKSVKPFGQDKIQVELSNGIRFITDKTVKVLKYKNNYSIQFL